MNKPPFWLACTIAAANILALLDMPMGYYEFLRLVVTGYGAYVSYIYFREDAGPWGWTFGTIALLYNPLFPVTMSKEFHAVHNLAVAGLVMFEFYRLRGIQRDNELVPEPMQVTRPSTLQEKAAEPKQPSGGLLRVVFPPLLALAIGVAIIATLSYIESRPTEEALEVASVEPSSAEFPGAVAAGLAPAEFSTLNSSPDRVDEAQSNSSPAQFINKIDSAVQEFSKIYKSEGLTGAQIYSENCRAAALKSYDILETDFCTAFDMAAARLDYGMATDLGMPIDEYFKNRATTLKSDYTRFSQTSENRTDLIWQEVIVVLPSFLEATLH